MATSNTVKIRNLIRQSRVFNLEHPEFVNRTGDHSGSTPAGQPEAVTFQPLEVKELPASACECAEIKAALTRHPKRRPTLRVVN